MVNYSEIDFAVVSLGEKDFSCQILKDLQPKESVDNGIDVWHVTNKYFHADIKLCSCGLHEFHQNFQKFDKLEAVLVLFEYENNDSLNKLKGLSDLFNSSENPELRMLWEVSNATLKDKERGDIISWCLDNQFEFVENEEEDSTDEAEETGDLKEKYGSERIVEALRSHMWKDHRMKETDEGSSNTNNGRGGSASQLEEHLLQGGESFEELFGRLQAMKEQAQSLEGDARKDYAEKVTYAFMEALGIDDDTDDESLEDR